ncbi:MAG: hypothetical protein VZR53_05570 [Prevotella sp.]|nr:hypothetical protein [Prevotella sp.]
MKKLSIEEKAKRYDEALEKAEKWHNAPNVDKIPTFGNRIIEDIFPELYESEDERIKNEIIDYISTADDKVLIPYESWIAWLEKQGRQKSMKVYRVENEAEQKGLWRKFDGTYEPLFDMLTDGQCKDLPMEDSPIYREGGKRWFASAPSKETLQKWFSKKDLEELVAKGFTISEFEVVGYKKVSDFEYIFTRDNIINRNYLEVSDIYPEQKVFAPKVEPKFKVGDWIIHDMGDGRVTPPFQIIEMTNKSYVLDNGECFYFSDTEELYRKWTIKDAKDGDVLCTYECDKPKIVFILKGTPKKHRALSYYCYYNIMYPYFESNSKTGCLAPNEEDVKPATKEQRDYLFARMAEEGYRWDADKKLLIKL